VIWCEAIDNLVGCKGRIAPLSRKKRVG